jgi:hypothetical protein
MKQNIYETILRNDSIANVQNQKYLESIQVKTVLSFLKWYKDNYTKINIFDIVRKNNNGYYSVDFAQVEKYLASLNNGEYLSSEFINKEREYFKKCDSSFKKNLQNDGPPVGLDFDFILLTQDTESAFIAINNPMLLAVKIQDKDASIKIDIDMRLEFKLKEINGKWKINDIINLGLK